MAVKGRFIVTSPEESFADTGLRQAARTGARVGEQVAGFPGDVASGVTALAKGAYDITKPIQKYIPGEEVEDIKSYSQLQEQYPFLPPTSEDIRRMHEPYTGEYLKPSTENEQTADSLISTTLSLLTPTVFSKGLTAAKFAKTLGLSVTGAVLGETGAKTVKEMGGSELKQAVTKFVLSASPFVFNARSAVETNMKGFYSNARDSQIGKEISPRGLYKSLNDIEKKIRYRDFSGKDFIEKRLKSFDELLSKKSVSMEELWNRKIDLNNWYKTKEFWDVKKISKPYMDELIGAVNKTIRSEGKNIQGFLPNFEKAEEIFKGLNKTSSVEKFLSKITLPKAVASGLSAKGLGGIIGFSKLGTSGAALAAGGYAGGQGARQILKGVNLLNASPQARKIYGDIMKSAIQGSLINVIKNSKKLNKIADSFNEKPSSKKGRYMVVG